MNVVQTVLLRLWCLPTSQWFAALLARLGQAK